MATHFRRVADYLKHAFAGRQIDERSRLEPNRTPSPPKVPGGSTLSEEALSQRWQLPGMPAAAREVLADPAVIGDAGRYGRNIENFIGVARVPIGLAGPLRVNGAHASGDFYVPLATTEAALVASYSRGAQLITEAGGCAAVVVNEGVTRAPGFAFETIGDASVFVAWAAHAFDAFREAAAATTRHGMLVDMQLAVEGNHVHVLLEFLTGDASGQNMVTIATDAVCRHIVQHAPVKPRYWFVEANMSGDKKATTHSFMTVRGKKVSAEIRLPAALVRKRLHTTPGAMVDYARMSVIGGVMSGSIGVQGHYANGLAALFIACGQDAACVAEAAVGVTRFETRDDGSLYAAVTLPNLLVGTVGGGTSLPTQKACLDILALAGAGHARAFAEVAAALALAGELSIIGALTAGHFTRAHQQLARAPVDDGRGSSTPGS
jgi:hydroxymethylglutaryl-CoA reductase (NADPH)